MNFIDGFIAGCMFAIIIDTLYFIIYRKEIYRALEFKYGRWSKNES